jgi:hypothetical protein
MKMATAVQNERIGGIFDHDLTGHLLDCQESQAP